MQQVYTDAINASNKTEADKIHQAFGLHDTKVFKYYPFCCIWVSDRFPYRISSGLFITRTLTMHFRTTNCIQMIEGNGVSIYGLSCLMISNRGEWRVFWLQSEHEMAVGWSFAVNWHFMIACLKLLVGVTLSILNMSQQLSSQTAKPSSTFYRQVLFSFFRTNIYLELPQCILPCIVQLLPAGSPLVHCIRAYVRYRMMIGMHCMTEERLQRLRNMITTYKKCCDVCILFIDVIFTADMLCTANRQIAWRKFQFL